MHNGIWIVDCFLSTLAKSEYIQSTLGTDLKKNVKAFYGVPCSWSLHWLSFDLISGVIFLGRF